MFGEWIVTQICGEVAEEPAGRLSELASLDPSTWEVSLPGTVWTPLLSVQPAGVVSKAPPGARK